MARIEHGEYIIYSNEAHSSYYFIPMYLWKSECHKSRYTQIVLLVLLHVCANIHTLKRGLILHFIEKISFPFAHKIYYELWKKKKIERRRVFYRALQLSRLTFSFRSAAEDIELLIERVHTRTHLPFDRDISLFFSAWNMIFKENLLCDRFYQVQHLHTSNWLYL